MFLTQVPHLRAEVLLPTGARHLASMQNFVGMLEYFILWRWCEAGVIVAAAGAVFDVKSLPLILDAQGAVEHLSTYAQGAPVFPTELVAFHYLPDLH